MDWKLPDWLQPYAPVLPAAAGAIVIIVMLAIPEQVVDRDVQKPDIVGCYIDPDGNIIRVGASEVSVKAVRAPYNLEFAKIGWRLATPIAISTANGLISYSSKGGSLYWIYAPQQRAWRVVPKDGYSAFLIHRLPKGCDIAASAPAGRSASPR